MKRILLFAVCSAFVLISQAQTIKGKIVDASKKNALSGATISANNKVVVTDAAGKFTLEASAGDLITVTFVGMKPVTLKAGGLQNLSIELEEGEKELDQFVVIGYQAQRKKDLTGAVAVVDLAPVKNSSSGNTMQALQGRVAGLYIEKNGV